MRHVVDWHLAWKTIVAWTANQRNVPNMSNMAWRILQKVLMKTIFYALLTKTYNVSIPTKSVFIGYFTVQPGDGTYVLMRFRKTFLFQIMNWTFKMANEIRFFM